MNRATADASFIPSHHSRDDASSRPTRDAESPATGPSVHVLEAGAHRAEAPVLSPQQLHELCVRLRAAGKTLRTLPTTRIIRAIDAAAARIHADADSLAPAVAAFTRTSPIMATFVIRRMAEDWRAPALQRLVQAEFGDADVPFPVPSASGGAYPVPPGLALHVFSGNVPGVSVTSIARALLVRSPVIGKVASGEPVLTAAFARALAAADEVVAGALAVTYWRGGDEATEDTILARVDQVVHYGGAESVAALRARASAHLQFVEHGPKVSLAFIGSRAEIEQAAADCAHAVALFDQQGCVSPQAVFVVGSASRAVSFADALARALDNVQQHLPAGPLSAGEAAAVRALRTAAEFADPDRVRLWEGDALSWTVVCTDGQEVPGSCLNRTVIVRPVPGLRALPAQLEPVNGVLQTVGADGFDAAALSTLAGQAALAGATRVCAIRDMPWPPPAWHHDGRPPLRELVRWMDVETPLV